MKKIFLFTTLSIVILAFISCGRNQKTESSENQTDKEALGEQVVQLNGELFREMIWDYTSSPDQWKYKGNKPSVIDFYADWCKPCRIVAPIMEELALKYQGKVTIYKVNTDKEKEVASAFGIRGIPSVLFCPKKGKPQMATGALPKDTYVEVIEEFLLGNNKSSL
ncbi:MAG TPA: thiol reductase thioredoxin [Bacteroidales bacterium]|nr:thiol reductase thioredoxin [Bacteroidales bacterium]